MVCHIEAALYEKASDCVTSVYVSVYKEKVKVCVRGGGVHSLLIPCLLVQQIMLKRANLHEHVSSFSPAFTNCFPPAAACCHLTAAPHDPRPYASSHVGH